MKWMQYWLCWILVNFISFFIFFLRFSRTILIVCRINDVLQLQFKHRRKKTSYKIIFQRRWDYVFISMKATTKSRNIDYWILVNSISLDKLLFTLPFATNVVSFFVTSGNNFEILHFRWVISSSIYYSYFFKLTL